MTSRRAKSIKLLIFITTISALVFIVMFLITNHSSRTDFHNFMKVNFGNTNRWSRSYGPEWLVAICRDISALGGHIEFVLIVGFVSCFLFYLREKKRLTEFLIIIFGALILLFLLKFTMNTNSPDSIFDVFLSDELGFPSGHALMSLVLFSTLAKYSGRKLLYTNARYVIYAFAAVLIFLIGISRLFTSHTPTEVIAGWSAGIFWLAIVNYIFRKH